MKKIIVTLSLLFPLALFAQSWYARTNMPESIRAGNTASYTSNGDSYLFVVSGRNQDGNITPSTQRYQLSTNTWSRMADHPTGLLGSSTAIVKDSLYVIGGLVTTPGNATRQVYKYSINEDSWSFAPNFPSVIVDSDAVAYQDSLIYVAAGYNNRVRVYNAITKRWRAATPITPTPQSFSWGALTVKDNTLVYMCGADGFLSPNYNNEVRIGVIDQNNRANITWSVASPFPGETRTFFDAHPWENGIIMTGGSTDNTFETYSDECYHYNIATDTWTELPSKPNAWLTGNSGSLNVNGNWMLLCAGGYASDYLYQTEVFSTAVLSNNKPDSSCNWKNFKILIQTRYAVIKMCLLQDELLDIAIHDSSGRQINQYKRKHFNAGETEFNLQLDSLSNGIYFCTIKNKQETITQKLLVK
ncbi:Kelch repeat-containing protein [Flavobacterium sp.]